MCLYPTIIRNKKYIPNKKNKGNVPILKDERTQYVPIGCGKCIECLKKKGREWQVRLLEELKTQKMNKNYTGHFVTLTFNDESLNKFKEEFKHLPKQLQDNEIATRAIRLFLERWRKSHKKSLKHWLIPELGHTGTERLHIHGIIFTELPKNEIIKHWTYGYSYTGYSCNEKTINYVIKYISKIDLDHKWFIGKIHCSPGIGKNYINTQNAKINVYNEQNTDERYKTTTGSISSLPIYFRNKIYTEEQRENLWIKKLDEEVRYVMGNKISVKTPEGEKTYESLRDFYRKKNQRLGFDKLEWDAYKYKKMLNKVKKPKKINNIANNSNTHNSETSDNTNNNRDLNNINEF